MAVGGVSGSPAWGASDFQRINRMVDEVGGEKTSMYMRQSKSNTAVSKLGHGELSQTNDKVVNDGERATSKGMEKAASYTRVSNFGNETKLGSSAFQKANVQVGEVGEQKTRMYAEKGRSYTGDSNFGNGTKFGKSAFQQMNRQAQQQGQSSVSNAMRAAKQAYSQKLSVSAVDVPM